MATLTKAQKTELQREAQNTLRNYGIDVNSILNVMTEYTGNTGTAQSRVFFVLGDQLINITALVARASGYEPKERKSDGRWVIRTSGYGYSRAQHITDGLSWAMFGRGGTLQYSEF